MANLPILRTKDQIVGSLIDGILSRIDAIDDFNRNSVIMQILEAVGQSQFKAEASIISMIDALSVDRAVGEALRRLAADRNVPIFSAVPSTGTVEITDLSFNKIESAIYAGQPAPVAGSLQVYVVDASLFPTGGGQLYIGRGTPNVEGPLQYDSVTPQAGGAYWLITLSAGSPTSQFHNIGEQVLLGQGGHRDIPSGTIVQTKQATSVSSIQFATIAPATILDGDILVQNVPVVCKVPGPSGNVTRGAIQEGLGLPFPVKVYNPQPYSNGQDADTDELIRQRIKLFEQTRARGTALALQTAALNVLATDEQKRVLSSSVIQRADNTTTVIIDDGTGYEYNIRGVGIENIMDNAIGGEIDLQLRRRPVAQARVITTALAPYNMADGALLSVTAGGETTVHQFLHRDFLIPTGASAFEIAASINGNPNINFLAATVENQTKVSIYARDRNINDIQVNVVPSNDANTVLQFPLQQEFTARLYKNDLPLYQDGVPAVLLTQPKPLWLTSITDGDTLIYQVDNTPPVTASFTLLAFQTVDPASTVSYFTAIETWAAVMNSVMPGVTASVLGNQIVLTSNLGYSSRAQIAILGGTLLEKIFDPQAVLLATGQQSDYTLNKQTGQIALNSPLLPGDKLTAGSAFTRAKLLSQDILGGNIVQGRLWFIVDGDPTIVPSGVQPTTQFEFQKWPVDTVMTITATAAGTGLPEGFTSVQPGDWLLLWANAADPSDLQDLQGWWRIETVQQGEITVRGQFSVAGFTVGPFTFPVDRLVIVRSSAPIQQLAFETQTITDFLQVANAQLVGITVDLVGAAIRFSTQSTQNGDLTLIAADAGGQSLGIPVSQIVYNLPSHSGSLVTSNSEASIPLFTHSRITDAITDTEIEDAQLSSTGAYKGSFIQLLDRYDAATLTNLPDSNLQNRILITHIDEAADSLTLLTPQYMLASTYPVPLFNIESPVLQTDDRYFLRSSYQFDSRDTLMVVVDDDNVTKSYTLPIMRRITVSGATTPTHQDFSADDAESTLELGDSASFEGFDFRNFKIWRQSHVTLDDTVYSIRFKIQDFGPIGDNIRVGFIYPQSPNDTELTHQLAASDVISVGIALPFTRKPLPLDGTTSFTVAKNTVGGLDEITYTYRAGTDPDWIGSGVAVGDVVIISDAANLLPANRNFTAKIIDIDATYFTVARPTGIAVDDELLFNNIDNEGGILTVTINAGHLLPPGSRIGFYDTAPSTAGVYPFDTTYHATPLSSTVFTVPTPPGTPGGSIVSAIHSNNIVTINTAVPHNLAVGNFVKLTNSGATLNGLMAVFSTPTSLQFQCVRVGSSASVAGGRYDFQSWLPQGISVPISSIARNNLGVVTVTTTAPHGFASGNHWLQINGVDIDEWDNSTSYNLGDVVLDAGDSQLYKAIINGTTIGDAPKDTPSEWLPTAKDLEGSFFVTVTGVDTFTYNYHDIGGETSGTNGACSLLLPSGALARAVGSSVDHMAFGGVSTTAQEVVDYVTSFMGDQLAAEIMNGNPNAIIDQSSEDIDIASQYYSGAVNEIRTTLGSRSIQIEVDTWMSAGSRINISTGAAVYDGEYIVRQVQGSAAPYTLLCWSAIVGSATGAVPASAGTFVGSSPYQMAVDGENFVESFAPNALPTPMFTADNAWSEPPEVGEELRLLAYTADQLTRFWSRQIVTGLSNVADIQNSEFGQQIQFTTDTFGATGAVQVMGGYANSGIVALVGTSQQTDRVGIIHIPFELRRGLGINHWIRLNQTIRQNKLLGLAGATGVRVHSNGLSLESGSPGTFQVQRTLDTSSDTRFRLEHHGNFLAIIHIGGDSPNFASNGVTEGDWLRIRNVYPRLYSASKTYRLGQKAHNAIGETYLSVAEGHTGEPLTNTTYWARYMPFSLSTAYVAGEYVHYNGQIWQALQNSLGILPSSDYSVWRPFEFSPANEGIFQVIRVWDEHTVWVENPTALEEMIELLDPNDFTAYRYDSVMPGDTVVVEGDVLEAVNSGRYTVADDAVDGATFFPTPERLWITSEKSFAQPTAGYITLGDSVRLLNVEEARPLSALKRILSMGASSVGQAALILDTPELTSRFTTSLGAYITMEGKLQFPITIQYGIDGYKYYRGLVREVNRVLYGDPTDPITYPGIRAAGSAVDIEAAMIRRIFVGLSIRIRSGIPFVTVRDQVKSSVAGYVNRLKVGEAVSISGIIAAASAVNGVISVVVTSPQYDVNNDLIAIGANERAMILAPTSDVIISVVGV